tara:strand:- start:818 stop:1363 length:546 start_codon:yes stop_codon:yes gene_type:complete
MSWGYAKKPAKHKSRKVTASILNKTCGANCKVKPPKPYVTWKDYLVFNRDQPKPYRSWLEFRLFADGPMKDVDYEPIKVDYEVIEHRKYTPDGVMGNVWFEVKGRFRTRHEMDKYIHVRKSNPMAVIIFVLHSANVALPGAQKRKDGSRRCMEDWLTENEFAYTYEHNMQFFMDNFNKGLT